MCHHYEAGAEREAYYERLREELEDAERAEEPVEADEAEPDEVEKPEPTIPADD